jgi:hypothetical protein
MRQQRARTFRRLGNGEGRPEFTALDRSTHACG